MRKEIKHGDVIHETGANILFRLDLSDGSSPYALDYFPETDEQCWLTVLDGIVYHINDDRFEYNYQDVYKNNDELASNELRDLFHNKLEETKRIK